MIYRHTDTGRIKTHRQKLVEYRLAVTKTYTRYILELPFENIKLYGFLTAAKSFANDLGSAKGILVNLVFGKFFDSWFGLSRFSVIIKTIYSTTMLSLLFSILAPVLLDLFFWGFLGFSSYVFQYSLSTLLISECYFSDFLYAQIVNSEASMIIATIGLILSFLGFSFYFHHGEYISKFEYLAQQFNAISFHEQTGTTEIDHSMLNFVEDCLALKFADNDLFKYSVVSTLSVVIHIFQKFGNLEYLIAFYPWKNIRSQVQAISTNRSPTKISNFLEHFELLNRHMIILSNLQKVDNYDFESLKKKTSNLG